MTPAGPATHAPTDARQATAVTLWQDGARTQGTDWLAPEEPLQIEVAGAAPLVTMRTPGHDEELAAGLLFGEGVVREAGDIVAMHPTAGDVGRLRVLLRSQARERYAQRARSGAITSACGVCGKRTFDPPEPAAGAPTTIGAPVAPRWLLTLPAQLRARQEGFAHTGGLHAAALFALGGELLALREDVGRHNALDKLVGQALLQGQLPWSGCALMLSGRASYELLQKAARAQVALVCAISAPSSYAVRIAQALGITLVGFLRGERFNVYSGAERIAWDEGG
ncbi:MAG: formate dehydrogenase accessory sulfurtransferase FdhD [Comamonadaceae bacterium]|nr:formate dehydrogenase accessory sulfurtransferase FdhD [Burkholderiales bacterium]MEB2347789.1 formate dehydrogenase accessory sulfurtransferase FdhD [Comamonadaceae bacterium]